MHLRGLCAWQYFMFPLKADNELDAEAMSSSWHGVTDEETRKDEWADSLGSAGFAHPGALARYYLRSGTIQPASLLRLGHTFLILLNALSSSTEKLADIVGRLSISPDIAKINDATTVAKSATDDAIYANPHAG